MAPSDFIMTLSSDDEFAVTTVSAADGSSKGKAEKPKSKTASRNGRKRKRNDADDEAVGDDNDDDESAMTGTFAFDGLGGGFVGDKRQLVWDDESAYAPARPNALPRVTVDDIIARRAPIRAAKAALDDDEQDADESDDLVPSEQGEDEELDELEMEMLQELEDEMAEDESAESADDVIESDAASDGADEAVAADAAKDEGEEDDDWLNDGEDDEDEAVDADAPTGFAALADMDDQGDDDEEERDDIPASDDEEDDEEAQKKAYFTSHTNSVRKGNVTFATIPNAALSRQLLLALESLNLSTPTPIQRECIPVAMMGKDIVASSRTGSGKTVAFWVGVLERLLHRNRKHPATRVVVLCPTRELAVQVHGVGKALARYTDVQFCLCVGGMSLKVQEAELKQRPDVVVSTPGRLIDHVRNTPSFTMDSVEILIMDEADRMLEEGFRAELEEIIDATPRSRQTLLFSATVTESISQLTRLSMNKPVRIKIDELGATAQNLVQEFLRVRGDKAGEAIERGSRSGERNREALLVALCTRSFSAGRTIVFFRSKAQAHRMKILFSLYGQGLERSDELHGDLTQDQRLASLKRFRDGQTSFLLATDLASRGLDIKGIENVINYEMPKSVEIYVHRVGRTARAGRKGRALTLVGEGDRKLVKQAMKHAPAESIKQRTLPVDVIAAVSKSLRDLDSEVRGVMQEEAEEKAIRRGDMEVVKARNLIEHADEIKSRPARTWFQSTSEKNAARNKGTLEHNQKFATKKDMLGNGSGKTAVDASIAKAPKRNAFSGLSRKEKRRKMAAIEDARDAEVGKKGSMNASIRKAKKAALPRKHSVFKDHDVKASSPSKKKNKKKKLSKEMGVAR